MADWSELDLESLRRLYPNYSNDNLGTMFGRSARAVGLMARKLGLAKSAAHMAQFGGRFAKGHISANTGKKGVCAPGSEKGWFKKGGQPRTALPVGTLRVTKDGTLQRKISETPGPPHRRWRSVHELVWIAHHGPMPRGHICVFKRGQWTNRVDAITIERVECISLAENMRRNTKHRLPIEIVRLIALRGALTRHINRRKKPRGSSS